MTAEEKRYIQARLAGHSPSMAAQIAVSQPPYIGFMEWIRAADRLHESMHQWEQAEEEEEEDLPCTPPSNAT